MTLFELQAEVGKWNEQNFPDAEAYQPLLGITEEVGELCHAHLKQEQGIRIHENHHEAKIDAIGDIIIYIAAYCCKSGIDLHRAIEETWEEVKKRDWTKNKKDGIT